MVDHLKRVFEHAAMRRAVSIVAAFSLVFGVGIAGAVAASAPASAVDGSGFDAGLIIADSQFFNGDAMTAEQVQSFLNSQVPVCDTWHTGSGINQPPFTCLKDYRSTHPVEPADSYCAEIPAGNHSSAEIIALVGKACGISQKVLLVLLQKEQSLVTDKWPWERQYRAATGYGCPDTADCDARYYGFFNQVVMAAWQFKYYAANPSKYRYKAGQWNEIQYHPDTDCGTKSVYIQNSATAALYIYTPYTPNSAALDNLYTVGDSCSSYGNRNFWRIYSDWFGSPTELKPTGVTVSRIGGADRYDVAVGVSSAYFQPGVPVVYVTSGEVFADAVGAGPAAAHDGGPVLIVPSGSIPPQVKAELTRLAPQRIVVVGGPASVSDAVFADLGNYSPQVERVGGADRYEVSRALASQVFAGGSTVAYLATGAVFADALSSGAAAGSRGAPVILVDGSLAAPDQATLEALQSLGVMRIYVSGGPASVSEGYLQGLAALVGVDNVSRFTGSDRYAVSAAVNRDAIGVADTFFVASGLVFADALSAVPAAAAVGGALYVTQPNCADRAMLQHLVDASAKNLVIVGGPGSVNDAVAQFRNC